MVQRESQTVVSDPEREARHFTLANTVVHLIHVQIYDIGCENAVEQLCDRVWIKLFVRGYLCVQRSRPPCQGLATTWLSVAVSFWGDADGWSW